MFEAFREELLTLLKISVDRREARVMIAQAQLRLTRDRISDADRDQFWKALLQEVKQTPREFADSDVFRTAMADITLNSIRCGKDSYLVT